MLNNKEFYPTPQSIIRKMINHIDFSMIQSVLEPSAGKGDIAEIIREKMKYHDKNHSAYSNKPYKGGDIDCIEIDQNLRHILTGKSFRVVHDDFLTYRTLKQYSLICLNPPFSNGDKHLLKAIEMQEKYGGFIVCLLNAETIKNSCSNYRIDLKNKLDELKAEIEYIPDAFIDAERKTGVEIALVKINIPQREKQSFIFEELKQEEQYKQSEYKEETNYNFLAQNNFIKVIVDQYNIEVKAGIRLINEYIAMKPHIMRSFKEDHYNRPILKLDFEDTDRYSEKLSINSFIKKVRYKYWETLFNNPQFIGLLTQNLRQDFYNKINELVDYDFSVFNIYTIKQQMNASMIKGVEDTILSLYDELSNKHHWYDEMSKNVHYFNGWKTNKAFKINQKVIIPLNGFDSYYTDRTAYSYKVVDKLSDMEKVFNYLDGCMTQEVDMNKALKRAEAHGVTKKIPLKFFNVTFYKKGTCHIEFTNEELLHKFNIFGSQKKGWLPPVYGKAKYKDMTTEEQTIIDEFEGKASYEKTITNTDYYIYDPTKTLSLEAGELDETA